MTNDEKYYSDEAEEKAQVVYEERYDMAKHRLYGSEAEMFRDFLSKIVDAPRSVEDGDDAKRNERDEVRMNRILRPWLRDFDYLRKWMLEDLAETEWGE